MKLISWMWIELKKLLSTRNDILGKTFWYTLAKVILITLLMRKHFHIGRRDYWKCHVTLGADLSQGDDFCSFTFMFPLSGGAFGIKLVTT